MVKILTVVAVVAMAALVGCNCWSAKACDSKPGPKAAQKCEKDTKKCDVPKSCKAKPESAPNACGVMVVEEEVIESAPVMNK